MIKKYIGFLFLIGSLFGYSQIFNPVKWSTSVEKLSDTDYNLVTIATIDSGWNIYSQDVPENGPIPTAFIYDDSDASFKAKGNTTEDKGATKFDPIFKLDIKYFKDSATFKQRITLSNPNVKEIKGEVEFMACDHEKCLPPKQVDLVFDLSKAISKTPVATSNNSEPAANNTTAGQQDNTASVQQVTETPQSNAPSITATTDTASNISKAAPVKSNSNRGLWTIFLLAFISGFAALLTPCVFPLIPMTVSFFTKQSKTKAQGIKHAIIYGISIIVIYVLLGTLVTAIFGADALNALASNHWFNLIFFIILVVFAVSFLGAFEIMLPNSWANKIDSKANYGGIVGIFFMALALAIVSFSCTGPIVGTLLVEAASKGGIAPIIGMFGFSLAIALPFALFAAFPGWLNSLPKSGGWLNTVKVVLGFLELALAFKFLSNADYVLQLHFLEREVFIAIWIAIFTALTLYLFGKIKMPHDSPLSHISVGRMCLGLVTLTFTIYMIPGLIGAPLNIISAFPPPVDYSESPYGIGGQNKANTSSAVHENISLPDGASFMAPHNIMTFKNYDKGLAYAKQVNKPVMIDFTGYTCVNCRKMEQNVWAKPEILDILKNKVVIISLYVDDKKPLPENEIKEYASRPGKYWKDWGDKWSDMQATRYNANSQPFYVLMDLNENKLNEPVGYTPDVNAYKAWLEDGISKFSNK